MRRVCFLPQNATSWSEMLPVAALLAREGQAEPVVLLTDWRVRAFAPDCQREGLRHRALGDWKSAETPALRERVLGGAAIWYERMHRRLLGEEGFFGLAKRRERRRLARQTNELARALAEEKPDSVVVYSGRMADWELPLLGCCRRRGIPSRMLPVAYVSHKEALLWSRDSFWHRADSFPALKEKYPEQAARTSPSAPELLFYPAPRTAALGEVGLLPPNPWAPGAGWVDVVMAEGEEAKDRFLRGGASPGAVVVTGHRVHDQLWRGLQSRKQRDGAQTRPRVVMALPQLAEHHVLGWEEHWEEMRFLGRVLREQAADCLISLHPKMDPAKYHFLEADFGLPISQEPLSGIITSATVFMACLSSTVMWAMICRIPTIMFDFYGIDLEMEGVMEGLVSIKQKDDLAPALARLLNDPEYYGSLVAVQDRLARRLSPLDGRCGQRILAAILGKSLEG